MFATNYPNPVAFSEESTFTMDELDHLNDLFLSFQTINPSFFEESSTQLTGNHHLFPSTIPQETLSFNPFQCRSPRLDDGGFFSRALLPTITKTVMKLREENENTSRCNRDKICKTAKRSQSDSRKRDMQMCTFEYCTNRARSRMLCKRHGGGKRCLVDGCNRPAQCKGRCPRHGGATRCKVDGCVKFSQSQGLCKAHGGGTQCAFAGCVKNAHQNRFCRSHGGGLKCKSPGCVKWAQKSGFCCAHTKNRNNPTKKKNSISKIIA